MTFSAPDCETTDSYYHCGCSEWFHFWDPVCIKLSCGTTWGRGGCSNKPPDWHSAIWSALLQPGLASFRSCLVCWYRTFEEIPLWQQGMILHFIVVIVFWILKIDSWCRRFDFYALFTTKHYDLCGGSFYQASALCKFLTLISSPRDIFVLENSFYF